MNVDAITNVEVLLFWGMTFYIVTLYDGTIWFVPNDPDNRDYAAVQEWLALNGGE